MTATFSRTVPRLPFTEQDAHRAFEAWGCNCGPSALAAILGISLDAVRPMVEAVGFAEKRYMSPTMMRDALNRSGRKWHARTNTFDLGGLAFAKHGLVRIQWTGPWTADGANPRWAYRQTHWVASWILEDVNVAGALKSLTPIIFDVNSGLIHFDRWKDEIVSAITKSIPRADGDWFVTHCWEIDQ